MGHTIGATCAECGSEYQVDVDGPFQNCPECGHDLHEIEGRTFRTRKEESESIFPITIDGEFEYDPRKSVPEHDMPRHMRSR